eukprot:jgi/Ulvmu1/12771/UM096_0013.1
MKLVYSQGLSQASSTNTHPRPSTNMRKATHCSLILAAIATCGAEMVVVTKPQSVEAGAPAVLAAQLAVTDVNLPLCPGVFDALPVVFSHPLADDPSTESFTVVVGEELIKPTCATLAPADEGNEGHTVLLLGDFQESDTAQPMEVSIRDVSLKVNGSTVPLISDDGFTVDLDGRAVTLPVARNQTLVDFEVLDLSAEGNTAEDDEDGCAALFPGSTYAIRLIFSSGLRDLTPDGSLVILGADGAPARANELFSLQSAAAEVSADIIIGQADADGDNVADICVQGAAAQRDAAVVVVACAEGAAVVSPDGVPCSTPIEVRLDEAGAAPTATAPAASPTPDAPVQEAAADSSTAAAVLGAAGQFALMAFLLVCLCL